MMLLSILTKEIKLSEKSLGYDIEKVIKNIREMYKFFHLIYQLKIKANIHLFLY